VHSEQGVASGEPGGGAAALDAFGPFLRLAMDDAALLGSITALPAPGETGARAVAALGRGPERFSAAGHWASESLARAQGQKLGVKLAEIGAGELAPPAEPGAAIAAEPAPGREPAARWSSDSAAPREQGQRAPGGEGAGRSAAEGAPSADA